MDSTKNGTVGRLTAIASAVGIFVILLGGIYNLAVSVNDLSNRLDRNLRKIESVCLALKQLDSDIRFHDAITGKRKQGPKLPPFPSIDC